jgi:hypothetical protein
MGRRLAELVEPLFVPFELFEAMVDFLHAGRGVCRGLALLPPVRRVPSTLLYQRFYLVFRGHLVSDRSGYTDPA